MWLRFSGADIDRQAVDLSHPHRAGLVNDAVQHPGRVHAVRSAHGREHRGR